MHFIVSNVDSEEKTYKIQNVYNLVQSACLSWDVHLLNFKDSEFKADFHQKVTGSIQCKKLRKKKKKKHLTKEIHYHHFPPILMSPPMGLFWSNDTEGAEAAFCTSRNIQPVLSVDSCTLPGHKSGALHLH